MKLNQSILTCTRLYLNISFSQLPRELLCSINDRTRNINSRLGFLLNLIYRSDAQRSNKQKERKKQELERQVYNADHFAEEAGFPTSLVSFLQPLGTDESHLTILLRMKTQPFIPGKCTARVWINPFNLWISLIQLFKPLNGNNV